jgi:hypothetical protein
VVVALSAAVVYAVINLAVAGRLKVAARVAAWRAVEMIYLGKVRAVSEAEAAGSMSVPMAVPLALGVVVLQVMGVRMGGG